MILFNIFHSFALRQTDNNNDSIFVLDKIVSSIPNLEFYLHTVKCFKVLLCNTNNSIWHTVKWFHILL